MSVAHSWRRTVFIAASFSMLCLTQPKAAELVMFESDFCEWCDAWHAEIGPIYAKTEEGRRAPLRIVDIHGPTPLDLKDVFGVRFTPTFVIMDDDGQEVARINGYPGEDFFWGLLGEAIAKLPTPTPPASTVRDTKAVTLPQIPIGGTTQGNSPGM